MFHDSSGNTHRNATNTAGTGAQNSTTRNEPTTTEEAPITSDALPRPQHHSTEHPEKKPQQSLAALVSCALLSDLYLEQRADQLCAHEALRGALPVSFGDLTLITSEFPTGT